MTKPLLDLAGPDRLSRLALRDHGRTAAARGRMKAYALDELSEDDRDFLKQLGETIRDLCDRCDVLEGLLVTSDRDRQNALVRIAELELRLAAEEKAREEEVIRVDAPAELQGSGR